MHRVATLHQEQDTRSAHMDSASDIVQSSSSSSKSNSAEALLSAPPLSDGEPVPCCHGALQAGLGAAAPSPGASALQVPAVVVPRLMASVVPSTSLPQLVPRMVAVADDGRSHSLFCRCVAVMALGACDKAKISFVLSTPCNAAM